MAFELCGEVDGLDGIRLFVGEQTPDVILMDRDRRSLEGDHLFLQRMGAAIVILGDGDDPQKLHKAATNGAAGYLSSGVTEIAISLSVSPRTVETHISRILMKSEFRYNILDRLHSARVCSLSKGRNVS